MAADKQERLRTILEIFDRDWSAGETARTEAVSDLFFSRVSHWDDWLAQYTTLQYRGQFDVVRPVVRKLVTEMRKNPIDVRYRPKDRANPDAADTLMGMYRADMQHATAKISVNIAQREQIEAGVGAWRLITVHEDQELTSNNQVIRRLPLHEACSHVVWDANARQLDKSDAQHVTVITAFTHDGWREYAEKQGFDEEDLPVFRNPTSDYLFPWVSADTVYVGEYYEVEEKKEKVFIYRDPLTGEPVGYYQRDIAKVIDELAERGMEKVAERKVTRRRVYKSIITQSAFLKYRELVAGECLPIVPLYGEWGFVGDKEVYEGVVRLTKDGQRLRNMIMSFNADIVSRTPKRKPFFYPEQIAGYEAMYSGNDDYPYYLLNRTDENNGDLPPGPVAYMESPEVPQANALMLQASTEAVKEVATQGVSAEAVTQQVAFNTINQLNQRADLESFVFQDNLATAMRRDGEIYASMVNDLYDVPRRVTIALPDGGEKEIELLTQVVDYQSGEVVTLNDVRGRYECYTDVGPSFQSMKEQSRAEIQELLGKVPVEAPEWKMLLLQYFTLLDGKGTEMMREYANKQLVVMGLKKPETPEEEQALQQAQQQKQNHQDPNVLLAQAQMVAAQAEVQKAQNATTETQIKAFTAQQSAMEAQANTVYKLAQARNIDANALMNAIKLLNEVAQQQQQTIPTGGVAEIPQ